MNKIIAILLLSFISTGAFAQIIGKVDRKTKDFSIDPGQKVTYVIFGYRFANATTEKYICFSSNQDAERANATLPLGSYFDTDGLPPGSKVKYLGVAGTFGKMSFTTGGGKTTIFYIPKASFVMH